MPNLPRYTIRAMLASTTFLAVYISLAMPNWQAFRSALSNAAFGIPSVSRTWSLVWFAAFIATTIMLPVLRTMRIQTPALVFLVASGLTAVVNYILPVGML